MNEEKRNRIAAAMTVAAILLVVILVAMIIYQIITMVVLVDREKELRQEYDYYKTLRDNTESDIEFLESDKSLMYLALQLGYYFPD